METLTKNQEFGIAIANWFYKIGIERRPFPFVLNSEQAEAFKKRWKQLDRQNKKHGKANITRNGSCEH